MMMKAFTQVEVKCPAKIPKGEKQWETYIRDMERLARRNPKILFRRAKCYHLMNSLPIVCPLPMNNLMTLMQGTSPFNVCGGDGVSGRRPKSDLPMPSKQKLREAAKVPRGKSHGPDGVWPYLFYVLPNE